MNVEYSSQALDDLDGLPLRHAEQIARKIERLHDGLTGDIKALTNADQGYRLRSGDYRVLFDLDGENIFIRRIKNRRDAYS
jgi:mRNA interferase RelE/StbE